MLSRYNIRLAPWRRLLIRALLAVAAAAALLVSVGALLLWATPQGRTTFKTALFVTEVLPTVPVKPQRWFGGQPTRQEVRFPLANGEGVADLYLPPGEGRHSAVLLFLGVNPAGRDDPRVVGLGMGLARAGMVVMIPWSDTMTRKRVDPGEVDNLVRAFQYLLTVDRVDPERAGMGGFCVGASLAAVAAADPRIRDRVRFLNFFGGYYDAFDLVKAVVTRSRFDGQRAEPWEPDRLSVEVVRAQLIEGLPDPGEREVLRRVFIEESAILPDPSILSPEGQAVYRLLSGPGLEEADRLLRELPPSVQEALRAISPRNSLDGLKARVLIMHDREDNLVPSEESRRLARGLTDRTDTYFTEFSFFKHVDPTRPVSPPVFAREAFKFFLHMYNVLRITS